jgi:thiamine pyrophosphate-dependent acetolactate synthase large subunit-like protein
VCLTTSGPGFLNGLPALANATTNCFPMIQISGSSNRALVDLQRGDYQDLDQLNAARPFVKAAYRVDRVEDIGRAVARAIRTAVSGRPGGVYLDIPGAVLGHAMDAAAGAESVWRVVDPAPRQLPAPEAVDRALDVLAQARRPLIALGKGAAYAQADDVIREFVESTGIPFLPMSMAKGLLPDSHPQSAAAARSLAIARADAVLLVGARLNWLLGHGESPQWCADAKFVQVDIAASEFDSNQPIAAPLAGDIGSVISALRDGLTARPVNVPAEWTDELIEGDSAFGFSGMEIETICRYRLPVTVVILNNGGVYRGDEKPTGGSPAPTVLNAGARHELIAEAFGGKGYHVTTPAELQSALTEALASNGPSIIDCELDPAAGVESGHLANLNPTSATTLQAAVSAGA